MQKRNNYSFQKLYDELSSDQKAFSFIQNKIIRLFFNCFVIIKAINTSNCNCFITKNLKEKDERVDISKKKNK